MSLKNDNYHYNMVGYIVQCLMLCMCIRNSACNHVHIYSTSSHHPWLWPLCYYIIERTLGKYLMYALILILQNYLMKYYCDAAPVYVGFHGAMWPYRTLQISLYCRNMIATTMHLNLNTWPPSNISGIHHLSIHHLSCIGQRVVLWVHNENHAQYHNSL